MKLDLEKALKFMIHMNKEMTEEMNGDLYDPVEIIDLYDDEVFLEYGITKQSLMDWYNDTFKDEIISNALKKLSDSELLALGLTR